MRKDKEGSVICNELQTVILYSVLVPPTNDIISTVMCTHTGVYLQ